jgi:hypothetical protein
VNKSKIVKPATSLIEHALETNDVGVMQREEGEFVYVYFPGLNKEVKLHSNSLVKIDATKFGDSFPQKICNVCHKIYKTSDFDLNQNGKNNRPVRRPSCKQCRKIIDGVNMTAAEKKKWGALKPNHIDFECPICKKVTIPGVTSKVVLNHDHTTGVASGWICDSCNTGLGRFKDDVKILKQAIDYLESASQAQE